ncbi:hypothetical protein M9980_08595 [Sphingomonas donggukensis]|uniref:Uncharacterized protein n=1 Tax=Sphingomonas donggukensis TaxID=2949093 RepID=A0ABY4TS32_9SPHN|nr:hypothetical protein [Sphingomonas donggukensis]URW74635.1 hypothetical protein M9980_08595 [Sphingomonas donggukensis]
MQYHFEAYGPFVVDFDEGYDWVPGKIWWSGVDENYDGVSSAIGCYAFASGGANPIPWYVGKCENSKGFKNEVFATHKVAHFRAMASQCSGPYHIYLFPLISGEFDSDWIYATGKSAKQVIAWLETSLIAMAYARNPELLNWAHTRFLRSARVRGLMDHNLDGAHDEARMARKTFLGRG